MRQLVMSGVATVVVLFVAVSNAAAAPTKDQCIDADTRAQDLRRESKLLSSREALLVCVNEHCPKLVRSDCAKRLDELGPLIPSVTFDVKDGSGQDLSTLAIKMDDQVLADHRLGAAIEADPGPHTFVFQAPGLPIATITLVIHEGDRARRERVTLGPPAATPKQPSDDAPSAAAAAATQLEPNHSPHSGLGAQRTAALVAGGVGAAGLVVGAVFGALAISKKSQANELCPDRCLDQDGVDKWHSAKYAGTVSTVGFIVGGAALAGGALLWLTGKPDPVEARGIGVTIGVGSIRLEGAW